MSGRPLFLAPPLVTLRSHMQKKDLKKKRKKGCERDALLKWNRVNGAQCSPQFVQKYFIGEELYNEGKCKKEKI